MLAQEVFAALLMQTVANLAAAEANEDNRSDTCDITVADILGPLLKEVGGTGAEVADSSDRARDANFSLLSYSFSLVGLSSQNSNNVQLCQGWAMAGQAQRQRAVKGAGGAALGAGARPRYFSKS